MTKFCAAVPLLPKSAPSGVRTYFFTPEIQITQPLVAKYPVRQAPLKTLFIQIAQPLVAKYPVRQAPLNH